MVKARILPKPLPVKAKERPVKERPVKERPVKERPVKERPVKERPVKERLVKETLERPERPVKARGKLVAALTIHPDHFQVQTYYSIKIPALERMIALANTSMFQSSFFKTPAPGMVKGEYLVGQVQQLRFNKPKLGEAMKKKYITSGVEFLVSNKRLPTCKSNYSNWRERSDPCKVQGPPIHTKILPCRGSFFKSPAPETGKEYLGGQVQQLQAKAKAKAIILQCHHLLLQLPVQRLNHLSLSLLLQGRAKGKAVAQAAKGKAVAQVAKGKAVAEARIVSLWMMRLNRLQLKKKIAAAVTNMLRNLFKISPVAAAAHQLGLHLILVIIKW